MKWARDIEQFIAREREKFHAAQARRRPDRNVCCKCEYELTGLAELPPAQSPPDLRCPECGNLVSLRDRLWTDGKWSMSRLLLASTAAGIVFGSWMIGTPFAARWISAQLGLGLKSLLIVSGVSFGVPLILFFIALSRCPRIVMRGTALGKHGVWRMLVVGLPAWLLLLATLIWFEILRSQTIP